IAPATIPARRAVRLRAALRRRASRWRRASSLRAWRLALGVSAGRRVEGACTCRPAVADAGRSGAASRGPRFAAASRVGPDPGPEVRGGLQFDRRLVFLLAIGSFEIAPGIADKDAGAGSHPTTGPAPRGRTVGSRPRGATTTRQSPESAIAMAGECDDRLLQDCSVAPCCNFWLDRGLARATTAGTG